MLKFMFCFMLGSDWCKLYYVETPVLALDPCLIYKSQSNTPKPSTFPILTLWLCFLAWPWICHITENISGHFGPWLTLVIITGLALLPLFLCCWKESVFSLVMWLAFSFSFLLQLGIQYMDKNLNLRWL